MYGQNAVPENLSFKANRTLDAYLLEKAHQLIMFGKSTVQILCNEPQKTEEIFSLVKVYLKYYELGQTLSALVSALRCPL